MQTPKVTKQTSERRRKANPYGNIVTSDEQFQLAVEDAENNKTKEQKKRRSTHHPSIVDVLLSSAGVV